MYIYFTHYFLNRSTFHTDGLLFARPKLSSYHGMYQQSSLHKWLHIFCKIKLWGTKTMVNTCKERSLSYVFIVGQAKTKNMLDFPTWTVQVWLSWFYLNFYLSKPTYFGKSQKILDQTQNNFSQLMFTFRTMSEKLAQSTRKTWRTFLSRLFIS